MTIDRRLAIALGASLLIALPACTPNDPGLGSAARHNYAAQIVEPDPQYDEPQQASGDQTAGAQERYRKGAVKKPASIRTTDNISGGGGGGGSSGG